MQMSNKQSLWSFENLEGPFAFLVYKQDFVTLVKALGLCGVWKRCQIKEEGNVQKGKRERTKKEEIFTGSH